jgi:uncharacterized protein (TIGR00251 family)
MSSDHRDVVRESKGKVLLSVRVQPRSRQNAIVGVRDKSLLLKVNAPPVDGAANEAAIALLAKALDLPKSTFSVSNSILLNVAHYCSLLIAHCKLIPIQEKK